jgi:hypothetical protein
MVKLDALPSEVERLLNSSRECEWVEFKENFSDRRGIGEYISALSNGAA